MRSLEQSVSASGYHTLPAAAALLLWLATLEARVFFVGLSEKTGA
jgi:hypothetical protein